MVALAIQGPVEILMITHSSPERARIAIPHLLSTCDGVNSRVWLWHNGGDEETLEVTRSFAEDPRVFAFHHSVQNVGLNEPTNWLWRNASGPFVSKVDDDCLPEKGWIEALRSAHDSEPRFGAIGCWRFLDQDFDEKASSRKIERFGGDVRLLRNHWVQGSSYLLPRRLVDRHGLLAASETFTDYCIRLARNGAVNGWLYPFIREVNMDDPRSPQTLLKTDEDLARRSPLTARRLGIKTLADWAAQEHESALAVQRASLDIRQYGGWRSRRNLMVRKIRNVVRRRSSW